MSLDKRYRQSKYEAAGIYAKELFRDIYVGELFHEYRIDGGADGARKGAEISLDGIFKSVGLGNDDDDAADEGRQYSQYAL